MPFWVVLACLKPVDNSKDRDADKKVNKQWFPKGIALYVKWMYTEGRNNTLALEVCSLKGISKMSSS